HLIIEPCRDASDRFLLFRLLWPWRSVLVMLLMLMLSSCFIQDRTIWHPNRRKNWSSDWCAIHGVLMSNTGWGSSRIGRRLMIQHRRWRGKCRSLIIRLQVLVATFVMAHPHAGVSYIWR